MHFSSNLVYLRKKKKLSQSTVAEIFSISTNTVGSYERGDREPTLENLIALARFYGVAIDDLLTRDLRSEDYMLGKNLKYLRKREKFTQEDMSHLLGYKDKSSYCLIENGGTNLSIDKAMNISEFFGVTIDDLLKKDLSKEVS